MHILYSSKYPCDQAVVPPEVPGRDGSSTEGSVPRGDETKQTPHVPAAWQGQSTCEYKRQAGRQKERFLCNGPCFSRGDVHCLCELAPFIYFIMRLLAHKVRIIQCRRETGLCFPQWLIWGILWGEMNMRPHFAPLWPSVCWHCEELHSARPSLFHPITNTVLNHIQFFLFSSSTFGLFQSYFFLYATVELSNSQSLKRLKIQICFFYIYV